MVTSKLITALCANANHLVAESKGLLAMDESYTTCALRFSQLGIVPTEESRRAFRELLICTPGLNSSISGAILFDETIHQRKKDGTPLIRVLHDAGVIPGIKVDTGTKELAGHPGETITEGLDGLREHLQEYYQLGARFAKWRTVITLSDTLPSPSCLSANAHAIARYASLCQETGLVPIIETDVLMKGDHTLERCRTVTEDVLQRIFRQLYTQHIVLEGMLLKPGMVLPGSSCPHQATLDEIADATVKCFLRVVPAAVPGVVFLSGGQGAELATSRLNAMNVRFRSQLPWALSFSFARALQQRALEIWAGQETNVLRAQHALLYQAQCCREACLGKYLEHTEFV